VTPLCEIMLTKPFVKKRHRNCREICWRRPRSPPDVRFRRQCGCQRLAGSATGRS
jgi:hypothetical protein